jgi:hypothetical protein
LFEEHVLVLFEIPCEGSVERKEIGQQTLGIEFALSDEIFGFVFCQAVDLNQQGINEFL